MGRFLFSLLSEDEAIPTSWLPWEFPIVSKTLERDELRLIVKGLRDIEGPLLTAYLCPAFSSSLCLLRYSPTSLSGGSVSIFLFPTVFPAFETGTP